MSKTVLNRSAVKSYALSVSTARRAGKFTRVGEEFFLRCEARLESAIRAIANNGTANENGPPPLEGVTFVTKTARAKAEEMLETFSQRIIFTEVMRHPSVGVTLK